MKKRASKVVHNLLRSFYFTVQPSPQPRIDFFILWNLRTSHLFSYLWLSLLMICNAMFCSELIVKESLSLFHNNKFKEIQNLLLYAETSFEILVKSSQDDFNNISFLFSYVLAKLVGNYSQGIFFFSLVYPIYGFLIFHHFVPHLSVPQSVPYHLRQQFGFGWFPCLWQVKNSVLLRYSVLRSFTRFAQ